MAYDISTERLYMHFFILGSTIGSRNWEGSERALADLKEELEKVIAAYDDRITELGDRINRINESWP